MNLVLGFLWVFVIEYIENLPFIIGIVYAWVGLKKGIAWWKWLLMLLIGSFGCAATIAGIDWVKLIPTTLTPGIASLANTLRIGVIFSIGAGLLFAYFTLTTKLKKPFWADVVFGVIVAVLIAVVEVMGMIAPQLIIFHALGFATAASGLVTLIRFSAGTAPGKPMLLRVALITLVMSVPIVMFDYLPHLRG